jgi:hypothetical protein
VDWRNWQHCLKLQIFKLSLTAWVLLLPSICTMKILLAGLITILFQLPAFSQSTRAINQLQQLALQDSTKRDSLSKLNALYNYNGLHYLQPILKDFRLATRQKPADHFNNMAIDFAFAGDYMAACDYGQQGYDSMPPAGYQDVRNFLDTVRNIQLKGARDYILQQAANQQVIMLNETRYMPQHRAFTLSLLEELYKSGFRYLATDLLNNRADRQLTAIDMRTGYFSAEPVAGEMLRKAIAIGYKLVAYEDTLADNHSGTGRDAIQAARIASILQKDPTAKILIHAAQAHISEEIIAGSYIPMAVAFKRFTGINPLTIDQTELTAGSSFEYGRYFYNQFVAKYPLKEPAIAFRKNDPVSLLENDNYDLQIIHPPTTLLHNRPAWLTVSNSRKEFAVKPTEKSLFMVQAYYMDEIKTKLLTALVPADQTYQTDNDGYYWLFLYPGKYHLVLRDIRYNLIAEKDIEQIY